MALTINKEIIDFIRSTEYEKDTQDFLIQALLLEFKRDKEDLTHYTKDYDRIIENYIDAIQLDEENDELSEGDNK